MGLSLITLLPFALGVLAVWAPPANVTMAEIDHAICAYAVLVLGFMGGVRWGVSVIRPGGSTAPVLLLALAPPFTTLLGDLLIPMIGGRWALALAVAAFSVQGTWDLSTDLPEVMKRARPIVTIGALAALLMALLAN